MPREEEGKIDWKLNRLQNTYADMQVLKSDSPDSLTKMINNIQHSIFIKAIYWSPSDNMHVAYILSQKPLNKEQPTKD